MSCIIERGFARPPAGGIRRFSGFFRPAGRTDIDFTPTPMSPLNRLTRSIYASKLHLPGGHSRMRQTVLSMTLEVEPESCGTLSGLIEELRHEEERPPPGYRQEYDRLKACVPVLHFMSLNVFRGADYDPIFVIEANFDGPAGVFWGQLEAALEPQLRAMLRCCKKPAVLKLGELYVATTAAGSRHPLAPFFEAMTHAPSVFHQGNRGLDRDRILQEGELFLAIRKELDERYPAVSNPYRIMTPQLIHRNLRDNLKPHFPWLDQPAPTRISFGERLCDLGKVVLFLFIVLFVLSLPGLLVLAPLQIIVPGWGTALVQSTYVLYLLVVPAVGYLIIGYLFYRWWSAREGENAPTRSGGLTPASLSLIGNLILLSLVTLILAIYGGAMSAIGAGIGMLFTGKTFGVLWWQSLSVVVFGFVSGIVGVLPIIGLWLRNIELRDSFHDAPPVDERMLRQMEQREDWIPQNHMGSVVLVKPGVLRMLLFRTGHLGLGLVLRLIATNGYLGSMRTVHFAHWAFINNNSRLMFFSNFDFSWGSYLDDFIEKAHGGLTLAWGSGVGFPPTRFLVFDGASHGRKFKEWARHSMAVSRFWFCAYEDYTVNQIERHTLIANGLRKSRLSKRVAIAWVAEL